MSIDLALLILRVGIGGLVLAHGTQKLFGWFGGGGLAGTHTMIQSLRLRPAWLWMWIAIFSEVGGGLSFALGFLNPLGALGIFAVMVMSMMLVSWPRFWGWQNGIEYNQLFMIPAIAVAISGPGHFSLDVALGLSLPVPLTFIIGMVLMKIGLVVALVTRLPASKRTAPVDRALPTQPGNLAERWTDFGPKRGKSARMLGIGGSSPGKAAAEADSSLDTL